MMIVASSARKYVRVIRIQAGELQLRKDTESNLLKEGYEHCAEPPMLIAIEKFVNHFGGISEAARAALITLKEIHMDVTTATTQALVEFYNKHSEKPIKKFADRATAEKRCQVIVDALAAETPKTKEPKEPTKASKPKASKPKEPKGPRSSTVLVTPLAKSGKKGEQTSYRSVKDAFDQLGLPINQHKKFRKELKAQGKGIYEHDGVKYEFATV